MREVICALSLVMPVDQVEECPYCAAWSFDPKLMPGGR